MMESLVSFDSYEKYLRFEKRYSAHTITAYLSDLKAFGKYLRVQYGPITTEEVKSLHVRSWVVYLMKSQKASSPSINRKLSSLRHYFNYLLRKRRISKNPCQAIKGPKKPRRIPKHVRQTELSQLLSDLEENKDWKAMRAYILIRLLYETGMRRAELISLSWTDVSELEKHIRVMGKGKKERILPISVSLLHALSRWKLKQIERLGDASPYIICTDDGSQSYPKLIYNTVSHYLKLYSNAEKTSPHVLRHSFATHLSEEGAELHGIKELLGHSSLAATQVYTSHSLELLKKTYLQAHPKSGK